MTRTPAARGFGLAALAVALCLAVFALEARIGVNPNDEGFIWYGAVRAAHGGVPMRDFQAYDPGRYYWGALWFLLTGREGLLALRLSMSLFQSLGLFLGLLTLRRVVESRWLLMCSALVLLIWMVPSYKAFEITPALAAVYFGVRLAERPTLTRHFVAGIVVGVVGFIGRNLGLYCGVGLLLLILFVQFRLERGSLLSRGLAWGAGVLLGYSPMLLMFAFTPGFWHGFVEMNLHFVRNQTTNRPRPVPWPWSPPFGSYLLMSFDRAGHFLCMGIFFVLLPAFQTLMAAALLRSRDLRDKSVLLASTAVGLPYMHYAFSRADMGHLASSLDPLLIAIIAASWCLWPSERRTLPAVVLGLLATASLFAAGTEHPLYARLTAKPGALVECDVAGDRLWVSPAEASLFRMLKRLTQGAATDTPLFAAPIFPGFYPLLGIKSPVWTLLFPPGAGALAETPARQLEMIAELEARKVQWALLCDIPLDRRDELRLSRTNALLWKHLTEDWERVRFSELYRGCQIRKRPGS